MCQFFSLGLGWLPFTVVVSTCLTFTISYIVAIVRKDVPVFFPYISDTGAEPPESCIFGQLLNICSIIAMAVIYVRYKHVATLLHSGGSVRLRRLNVAAFVIGICSCLGMSLVANFQETTVLVVHLIGACILFIGGMVYELLIVIITYCMCPSYNGRNIAHIRLVLWTFSFIFTISSYVSAMIAARQGHSDVSKSILSRWTSTDPGYAAHIVSTFSEWFLAATFLFFFLTYIREFQKVSISTRTNLYARHMDDDPVYTGDTTPLLA